MPAVSTVFVLCIQLFLPICISLQHKSQLRQLLDITTTPIQILDCCERTTGLQYVSMDCYDSNTPIILEEVQKYLMEPTNECNSKENCDYTSSSQSQSESADEDENLCLIAWALFQQYFNECPQIVENQNIDSSEDIRTTTNIDNAPKLINPLIYSLFANNKDCMDCYDDDDEDGCSDLCDLSVDSSCGVCALVTCLGDINSADVATDFYGMGALEIWQRALLLATVTILGCVCCWGICYLAFDRGSDSFIHRAFINEGGNMSNRNAQFQVVSNDDIND